VRVVRDAIAFAELSRKAPRLFRVRSIGIACDALIGRVTAPG